MQFIRKFKAIYQLTNSHSEMQAANQLYTEKMISDDIFHKLSLAKMFTIIDISKGYYHIELEWSQLITYNIQYPMC